MFHVLWDVLWLTHSNQIFLPPLSPISCILRSFIRCWIQPFRWKTLTAWTSKVGTLVLLVWHLTDRAEQTLWFRGHSDFENIPSRVQIDGMYRWTNVNDLKNPFYVFLSTGSKGKPYFSHQHFHQHILSWRVLNFSFEMESDRWISCSCRSCGAVAGSRDIVRERDRTLHFFKSCQWSVLLFHWFAVLLLSFGWPLSSRLA